MDGKEAVDHICKIIMQKNKTNTVNFYELKNIYQKLAQNTKDREIYNTQMNLSKFERDIENIRRSKKFNFRPKNGLLKLSTIHSFKGWEVETLFLIISNPATTKTTEELIYTAMTRSKTNLIIFNLGNIDLNDFFIEHIK